MGEMNGESRETPNYTKKFPNWRKENDLDLGGEARRGDAIWAAVATGSLGGACGGNATVELGDAMVVLGDATRIFDGACGGKATMVLGEVTVELWVALAAARRRRRGEG
ncbi:hypothetical protein Salat_2810100 [Sesamum alatum]|uniref:Uncharacterized protein n=1 Tax=Sesamum alatum TaxID=300844 RepID=A0AAE2C9I9_9LAMI|nr:hypothetical protein Salat_2810100 [Sesamum alatum]